MSSRSVKVKCSAHCKYLDDVVKVAETVIVGQWTLFTLSSHHLPMQRKVTRAPKHCDRCAAAFTAVNTIRSTINCKHL